MHDAQNETSGKCLSGMLRCLLCTGSLPTHPSDNNFTEFNKTEFTNPNKTPKTESQVPPTPGIVARLMGLDSLPDINRVPKQRTTLDSIMRSRSVNSVDYFPQFDLSRLSHQHRRVRTSVSFREVPTTFMTPQNNDFLVLCFDKFDEATNIPVLNESKPKVGLRELEKKGKNTREKVPVKRRENEEKNKKSCTTRDEQKKVSVKPGSKVENVLLHKKDVYRKSSIGLKKKNVKEVSVVGLKCTKQTKNQSADKTVKSEFNSVNASPVSVAPRSENIGRKGLISRKKVSTKIDKLNYPSSDIIPTLKAGDQESIDINNETDKALTTGESGYYINVLLKVFRLTEEDTKMCKWPWLAREEFKFEDFEEICLEFGEAVLELLLNEIVDELCGTSTLHNEEFWPCKFLKGTCE